MSRRDYWRNVVDGAKKTKELGDYYKEQNEVIKSHLGDQEIIEVEHSLSCSSRITFQSKEFRRAAVVTLDGWGDGVNRSIRILDNKRGKMIELIMKRHLK